MSDVDTYQRLGDCIDGLSIELGDAQEKIGNLEAERRRMDRLYQRALNDWSELKQSSAALLVALNALVDPEDCRFDHHGHCQEHGHLSEGDCPHEIGKRLLREAGW